MKEMYKKGQQIKGHENIEVDKGKDKEVPVVTKEAFSVPVKNGDEKSYKAKVNIEKKKLEAPIKKGTKVGMLTTSYSGDEKDYGYLNKDQSGVELVTKTSDEKANWFILAMRGVGGFFAGIWGGIVDTVKGWF